MEKRVVWRIVVYGGIWCVGQVLGLIMGLNRAR